MTQVKGCWITKHVNDIGGYEKDYLKVLCTQCHTYVTDLENVINDVAWFKCHKCKSSIYIDIPKDLTEKEIKRRLLKTKNFQKK